MSIKCKICSEEKFYKVDFNNLYLRTSSYNQNLHVFESRVCFNCGVVYQFPQISEKLENDHYKSSFRKTRFPIHLNENQKLEFPLQFEQTGISFQRFYNFYKIIESSKNLTENLKLNENTSILDYGAYQGAFLYACKKVWNVRTIAYDNNIDGLRFAKDFLSVDKTFITEKVENDEFGEKIDICTAIQVLEHLRNPKEFFLHIKKNILKKKGYLYIEVPCALTSEFSNPVHLHMFTKESLEYLFKSCGFKILHLSEKNIYRFENINPIKRHIQTMVHCLAENNDEEISFNNKINIGKDIYNKIEASHHKYSNILYFKKLKNLFIEIIKLTYYGVFVLLGLIFKKFSYKLFIKCNNLFKKIKILKRISRK